MRRRGTDDLQLLSALRTRLRTLPSSLRGMLFMFLGTITGVCMHAIVRHMTESYVWMWPEPGQYLLLLLIAAFGTVTQLCVTQALRLGETAVVMPIDFFKLVWATAFGFAFFGEHPDTMTLVGGGMIFISATYIAWRESQLGRLGPKPQ